MRTGNNFALPLVSIIIPTYNCRKWVSEAVDSALSQTYPRCEIIVVDDGSNDGTDLLLQERYGDKIRYYFQDNKGRSAARNRGLKEAKGEYIQFLDADDLIMPEKIARQVEFLEANRDVDVVYGDVLLFLEDDKEDVWPHEKRIYYASGRGLLKKMLHEPFLQTVHALYRRKCIEAIGGFDESLKRVEDWEFHLRLARLGVNFHYLPDGGKSLYRQRRVTKPEERVSAALDSIRVVEKLRKSIDSQEAREIKIRKAKAMARFTCGMEFLRFGYRKKGLLQLLLSMGSLDNRTAVRATYLLLSIFMPPKHSDKIVDLLVRLKRFITFRSGSGNKRN
ncbi:MAG: glycosyltransferase [Candidatus Methanomethylicaceae archaeon]